MNLPTTDLTQFLQLPDEVRKEVEAWHTFFSTELSKPIQRALENIARKMGSTYSTARRKYDAWRLKGWRGLINRSKIKDAPSALTPEFIDFWKKLCEQNARKCKPAYREFLRRYKAGDPIPGISAELRLSVPHGTLLPGFSYDNLMRYGPTKFELAASRIGRTAAAPFRPGVLSTRVGLHVGSYFLFDDMWHDFKVCAIGQRKAMRLLQLHAHDLFSGCQFARGLKARMEDPETGKSIQLTQDEMLFLVAHVLGNFGYRAEGCVLIVEHGTAAIPEWLEKLLYDLSHGMITVERSGMQGGREFGETLKDGSNHWSRLSAFAGQYPGRGKGNFRFKASLESLGNLIHNETANLLRFPGQTGSNSRLNAPEELAGREKHADTLCLAICQLLKTNQALAAQLRLPFLEVNDAKWLVEDVMERINRRTEHELEGWVESHLTTFDYEVPGVGIIPAANFAALPPDRQAAVVAVSTAFCRLMSPREVFDAGRARLLRFRPEQTAYILKQRQGREVRVGDDHLITFEDSSISPEPLRYMAHHFPTGEKFLAVVNPWSPDSAHLFDAKGSWIGLVESLQRVRRDDHEAVQRQMGAAAKIEKELLAPLAARGAELTARRLEDSQHNSQVLKGEIKKNEDDTSAARSALMRSML